MDKLIERARRELSQLEDHKKHGELHIYIDENVDDLEALLRQFIKLGEGVKHDVAA